jgi:hypothetical protein
MWEGDLSGNQHICDEATPIIRTVGWFSSPRRSPSRRPDVPSLTQNVMHSRDSASNGKNVPCPILVQLL